MKTTPKTTLVMSSKDFTRWATKNGFSKTAIAIMERYRSSAPVRRTKGRGSVRGAYPSQKMGCTIQFEAHRTEFPAIIEFEHDSDVRAYLDQVAQIKMRFVNSATGKACAYLHVPDFFVFRTTSAGWVECKTVEELEKDSKDKPDLYQKGSDGTWRSPAGERAAAQYGFTYQIHVVGRKGAALTRNITFLDEYFRRDYPAVDKRLISKALGVIRSNQGISYPDLLSKVPALSLDDLNYLISRGTLYTDLRTVVLADKESVTLFTDRLTAEAIEAAELSKNPHPDDCGGAVVIAVSSKIRINGIEQTIIDDSHGIVQLLDPDGKVSRWKRCDLESEICLGNVTAVAGVNPKDVYVASKFAEACDADKAEANRRWRTIQPLIGSRRLSDAEKSLLQDRTVRRWVSSFQRSFADYNNGYIGLLPRARSGRVGSHLDPEVESIMDNFIKSHCATEKKPLAKHVHGLVAAECGAKKHEPVSFKTFLKRLKDSMTIDMIRKCDGGRVATAKRKFYPFLDRTTPIHGDRYFEIAHIDHTELDIELVCKTTGKNLGRPWLTLMIDAYTRRILAISLSFFSERFESCMRVIRECVKRHQRLPTTIVVDNGKAFNSLYFETLLANFGITKKSRPAAHPRFGSVAERIFGTIGTQLIHNLWGNTKATKNVRAMSESVNPKKLAIWTIGMLDEALAEYCYEIYDTASHSALGHSPREAAARSLQDSGHRAHATIPYNHVFMVLTMPTTEKGFSKVHPQKGVHVNYIDYWSDEFQNPAIAGQKIAVRYDPEDLSVVYALVRGRWVSCMSSHAVTFSGLTYRAVKQASEELRARKKGSGKSATINASVLARFMKEIDSSEEMALLRQRERATAAERKMINVTATAEIPKLSPAAQPKITNGQQPTTATENPIIDDDDNSVCEIERNEA